MNFIEKLSIFQAVLRGRFFGHYTPLACTFSITNRCPWKCRYCGFEEMHKKECSTDEALEIIRSLARMGNKRLHFTGGEPTLRKDIGLLVAEAKKSGAFVTIASSGFQFDKTWDGLKDIDIFFLSFDGPREIHDRQRGRGAYDVLMKAMDLLQQKGKQFWTTTVLTSVNIDHIDFILDTVRSRNSQANFHLLYFMDANESHGGFHPDKMEGDLKVTNQKYVSAIKYLLKRKRTDMKKVIGSSEMYLEALARWGDLSQVYRKERSPHYKCWAGKLYCYVDSNGDLYSCGDAMGRVSPKNSLELGFEKAFFSLPPLPCESCIVACFNELNLMFSLNFNSILNWLKKV